jgi:hypothetical protein
MDELIPEKNVMQELLTQIPPQQDVELTVHFHSAEMVYATQEPSAQESLTQLSTVNNVMSSEVLPFATLKPVKMNVEMDKLTLTKNVIWGAESEVNPITETNPTNAERAVSSQLAETELSMTVKSVTKEEPTEHPQSHVTICADSLSAETVLLTTWSLTEPKSLATMETLMTATAALQFVNLNAETDTLQGTKSVIWVQRMLMHLTCAS